MRTYDVVMKATGARLNAAPLARESAEALAQQFSVARDAGRGKTWRVIVEHGAMLQRCR